MDKCRETRVAGTDRRGLAWPPARPYFDTGSHFRPVTTSSPQAQTWFDRGLTWIYGFNHEESVVCFRRALEHDPDFAFAWWGVALASGPFYNLTWDLFGTEEAREATHTCHEAAKMALSLREAVPPDERLLIEAIAVRFPKGHPVPLHEFERWEREYADAMRRVYRQFPSDHDVAALFAEALMSLTPWKLWNLATGKPAENAATQEALDVIETALGDRKARGLPDHPGLLHMHLHLLEMSPWPERALSSADRLPGVVPDSGHLEHMPCHIHVLCGHYHRAVQCSEKSIAADGRFLDYAGTNQFYMISICHDFHMMMYAAMMSGRMDPAIQAANGIRDLLAPELLNERRPHLAAMLEGYLSTREHVLVRFGQWETLAAEGPPEAPELHCVTKAMHHYAKGVAHASLRQFEPAKQERAELEESVERIPSDRLIFNNQARDILEIGKAMLDGELSYSLGNFDEAFAHLRRAAELDDSLEYSEPWGWMHPPRHALGALLLEQGRVEEAAAVYRADLGYDEALNRSGQHLDNVWSLVGYSECLERQGRLEELAIVDQVARRALARADRPVASSCFCRRSRTV